VTSFFRDAEAWEDLEKLLTPIVIGKKDKELFRVWVPGCSTGEEAYSLAILLSELKDRHNRDFPIQIFATDVDAVAIDRARKGVYPESAIRNLPARRINQHFECKNRRVHVRKRIRESCLFAIQNILTDPPFSKLELISCRNLLIYLDTNVQQRIFDVMHFALNPEGLLFLGSSESLPRRKKLFETVSQKSKIYKKIDVPASSRGRLPLDNASVQWREDGEDQADPPAAVGSDTTELSRKKLLEEYAPASVGVDSQGYVQFIHGPVRDYLDFPTGQPDWEITRISKKGLTGKIQLALREAELGQSPAVVTVPQVRRGDETISVRIHVVPMTEADQADSLYLISFFDERPLDIEADASTANRISVAESEADQLANEVESRQRLVLELQATRKDLQSTIQELKASNEEVTSTNEELQSNNEELESSREELQSLNEELSTVNTQLNEKLEELEETTDDLRNLLASTDTATIFLDNELRIRRYTPATKRLMSILESDVGRPLSDLSSVFADPRLVEDAHQVLDHLLPIERELANGKERWYLRRITPFRTSDDRIDGVVITFHDVTKLKQAVRQLEVRERQQAVIAQLGRLALNRGPLDQLLDRATRDVAETLQMELCKVLQLDGKTNQLKLVAGVGWEEGLVGQATIGSNENSQAGYTLQTFRPVIVEDLTKEKRFSGPKLLIDHGVISGVSVIIGSEKSPWGVFGVHSREEKDLTIEDANFVVSVANVLGDAIRRETE